MSRLVARTSVATAEQAAVRNSVITSPSSMAVSCPVFGENLNGKSVGRGELIFGCRLYRSHTDSRTMAWWLGIPSALFCGKKVTSLAPKPCCWLGVKSQ